VLYRTSDLLNVPLMTCGTGGHKHAVPTQFTAQADNSNSNSNPNHHKGDDDDHDHHHNHAHQHAPAPSPKEMLRKLLGGEHDMMHAHVSSGSGAPNGKHTMTGTSKPTVRSLSEAELIAERNRQAPEVLRREYQRLGLDITKRGSSAAAVQGVKRFKPAMTPRDERSPFATQCTANFPNWVAPGACVCRAQWNFNDKTWCGCDGAGVTPWPWCYTQVGCRV